MNSFENFWIEFKIWDWLELIGLELGLSVSDYFLEICEFGLHSYGPTVRPEAQLGHNALEGSRPQIYLADTSVARNQRYSTVSACEPISRRLYTPESYHTPDFENSQKWELKVIEKFRILNKVAN